MKIYTEENLSNFKFWNEAKENANKLTDPELDQIEAELENQYPDGMEDTQLNDLFWFDFETVLEWISKEECQECGNLFESGEECECQEEEDEETEE